MAPKKDIELSRHETDVLLGLYSGCECLWNTKSSDYHVKAIRFGALRTIVNGMRVEVGQEFTVDQVQKKLQNVQSVYEKELQLVLNGERNTESAGETNSSIAYRSQWRWFLFLDSFLRNHVLQKISNPDGAISDSVKPASELQMGVSSDDNDADCTVLDSDNDDPPPPPVPTRHPSPVKSSGSGRATRPVITKPVVDSANGAEDSEDTDWIPATTKNSSRKKRKVTKTSPLLAADNVSYSVATRVSSRKRPNPVTLSKSDSTKQAPEEDHQNLSSQMGKMLKVMQTLLARSLSDQDQPAMVFARHITNELELISDLSQRKQCMLDIQRVILGYQSGQRKAISVKQESCVDMDDELTREEAGSASPTMLGDDSCPVHFGV